MKNEEIGKAVQILKSGGVIIFPTDTVWGMGAAISNKAGVKKFYRIKGREGNKPTAVLVSDVNMANRYGVMSKEARELAKKYWPGALTIVVKAKGNKVPKLVRGGGSTVGLRASDHPVTLELIRNLGEGIVAGSANFGGEVAPEKREELNSKLVHKVDLVIDGESKGQPASTVVDVTQKPWKIIRQGPIKINTNIK